LIFNLYHTEELKSIYFIALKITRLNLTIHSNNLIFKVTRRCGNDS